MINEVATKIIGIGISNCDAPTNDAAFTKPKAIDSSHDFFSPSERELKFRRQWNRNHKTKSSLRRNKTLKKHPHPHPRHYSQPYSHKHHPHKHHPQQRELYKHPRHYPQPQLHELNESYSSPSLRALASIASNILEDDTTLLQQQQQERDMALALTRESNTQVRQERIAEQDYSHSHQITLHESQRDTALVARESCCRRGASPPHQQQQQQQQQQPLPSRLEPQNNETVSAFAVSAFASASVSRMHEPATKTRRAIRYHSIGISNNNNNSVSRNRNRNSSNITRTNKENTKPSILSSRRTRPPSPIEEQRRVQTENRLIAALEAEYTAKGMAAEDALRRATKETRMIAALAEAMECRRLELEEEARIQTQPRMRRRIAHVEADATAKIPVARDKIRRTKEDSAACVREGLRMAAALEANAAIQALASDNIIRRAKENLHGVSPVKALAAENLIPRTKEALHCVSPVTNQEVKVPRTKPTKTTTTPNTTPNTTHKRTRVDPPKPRRRTTNTKPQPPKKNAKTKTGGDNRRMEGREIFLSKLASVLNDPNSYLRDVHLSWMPDGGALTILHPQEFVESGTMEAVFGIKAMSTFLRRLKQLGFSRVIDLTNPTNLDIFHKPGFGKVPHLNLTTTPRKEIIEPRSLNRTIPQPPENNTETQTGGGKPRKRREGRGIVPSRLESVFLSRLGSVLNNPDSSLRDVHLSWMPDGGAFTIVHPMEFVKSGTLHALFGIQTMPSFLRRLKQLGFSRIFDPTNPTNLDIFHKPGFWKVPQSPNWQQRHRKKIIINIID